MPRAMIVCQALINTFIACGRKGHLRSLHQLYGTCNIAINGPFEHHQCASLSLSPCSPSLLQEGCMPTPSMHACRHRHYLIATVQEAPSFAMQGGVCAGASSSWGTRALAHTRAHTICPEAVSTIGSASGSGSGTTEQSVLLHACMHAYSHRVFVESHGPKRPRHEAQTPPPLH